MIARDCALAGYEDGAIHIQHLSAAESVAAIAQAKADGVTVTCEASPHHLCLTDDDVRTLDTRMKMNPAALERHRQALIKGLIDGTIDCIATDHARTRATRRGPVRAGADGTTGLETAFAAVYTELVQPGVLALELVVEKLTCGGEPFGIAAPRIAKGAKANLTLVDLAAEWEVGASGYESRSANCCFDGRLLNGKVGLTLAAGTVAYRTRVLEVVG
jgi:dihydroorotase